MEIIKRGNPPKEEKYLTSCPICKSLLLCAYGELKCVALSEEGWVYEYTCPVCGLQARVFSNELTRVKKGQSQ